MAGSGLVPGVGLTAAGLILAYSFAVSGFHCDICLYQLGILLGTPTLEPSNVKSLSMNGTRRPDDNARSSDGSASRGTVSGSDETRKRRKNKNQAALWGVIGSLIGGSITGLATWAAADVTATRAAEQSRDESEATAEREREQFKAEADKDREEVLRGKRFDTYAIAVRDAQVFMLDVGRHVEMANGDRGFTDPQALADAAQAAEASYRQAVASNWNVRMIAPDALRSVNDRVALVMDCSYRSFTNGFQPEDVTFIWEKGERLNYLVSRLAEYAVLDLNPDAEITPIQINETMEEEGACRYPLNELNKID